jgi:hypothetical protein
MEQNPRLHARDATAFVQILFELTQMSSVLRCQTLGGARRANACGLPNGVGTFAQRMEKTAKLRLAGTRHGASLSMTP